ncbi:glycosyltransferase [Lactococcus lactis]|uniref:Glycosyltransferase n=1 Tax=Lactococcus lactis TaxID=1358 RepID=A0AAP5PCX2_9LACT|nr:glycosyltransferase [Lactococcus lactis]MDT2858622.1 glycosyltransferase [Lactococcus lactis]MDT2872559.1 glycosyltransferase [Lactococcus lactis]MDT2879970.1 glycosyltransferase [Lactococcus lactis]MDT2901887.1 glycosyltransferase [Lactococcus lactis]MDT2907694.1 glycosyltransferase [Lactococcus lactis]
MKTSVVIATYNGEEYIEEQLETIKNQTRIVDEVLIFDDLSQDGTVFLIKNFIEKYELSNWNLIVNKVNKGYSRNFYEGICKATGDIIFCCDQDDIWDKRKIENMVTFFEKNSKIKVLSGNYIYKVDNSLPYAMKLFYKSANMMNHFKNSVKYVSFSSKGVFSGGGPGWTLAIKKDYFEKISPFYNLVFSHDGFFNTFSSIDGACYKYMGYTGQFRRYSGSTSDSSTVNSNKKLNRELLLTENYLERVKVAQNYLEQLKEIDVTQQQKILYKQHRALMARKTYYLKKNLSSLFHILYFWKSFNLVWVIKDIMNYRKLRKEK